MSAVKAQRFPDYPFCSSGDDDPVRMRCRSCAGMGRPLSQGVGLVAALEAPGGAGKVAPGVPGTDMAAGVCGRGRDVAGRGAHPASLAAPIAQRAPSRTAQGEGYPPGRLRTAGGGQRDMGAAGGGGCGPAAQAVAGHVAAGGEAVRGKGFCSCSSAA